MPERQSDDQGLIGFALSGGGSRAASQVGALKALLEAGIWPDVLAGTSAGAVNATWFALHPHELDYHETLWLALRRQDVFPGGPLRSLVNLTRYGYVHAAHAWESYLWRMYGKRRFEDAELQCAVVAVSLRTGERVVFDAGEMVPAIMASTAIPGVFPPYRIGDELYVDGGVLEYMPIPTLVERGLRTIYALDCSYFVPGLRAGMNVVDRCNLIGTTRGTQREVDLARAQNCMVHLLRPEVPEITDPRAFDRTKEFLRHGYVHAHRYLQSDVSTGGSDGLDSVPISTDLQDRSAG